MSHIETNNDGIVEIDFSGVRTLTSGGAYNLFASLVYLKGYKWFREHIKCSNLDDYTRNIILASIDARIKLRTFKTLWHDHVRNN
jgi:hypothetical protein